MNIWLLLLSCFQPLRHGYRHLAGMCARPVCVRRCLWLPVALIGTLLIACQPSPSQREYVVGIINPSPNLEPVAHGFRNQLSEQIRLDGNEVVYIAPPNLKITDIDNALRKMKEKGIDLVFTVTGVATIKAKKMYTNVGIPIVFAPIYDPVQAGVIDKLVDHTSNITGVKIGGSNPKALEWLLTIVPSVKKVMVPFSNKTEVEEFSLADLQQAADKLDVELLVVDVKTRDDLANVLEKIPNDVDALWLLHSAFLVPNSKLYTAAAIKHKIPLASGTSQQEAGVMISYGQHHEKTGRQAGRLAYQILKGVPVIDLPVETADFFLGINLATANAAGIEIPYNVLLQAQEIIRNGSKQ